MSMISDEQPPLPPRDHNRPPSPVETISADQREALQTFQQRKEEILASANAKRVFDRISAGDAGDIIRIAGEVKKRIDAERMDRSKPYRDAADAAKGIVDEFWSPVDDALTNLRRRLKEWTDAEDARIAAQQAEQEAEMQRMRQARLPMHPMPHVAGEPEGSLPATAPASIPGLKSAHKRKIRGDLGATVSTVEKAQYRVVDVKQIPDWIMATPTVHEAIIQVVKSMAKHTGDIPGIERTTFTDNQIR